MIGRVFRGIAWLVLAGALPGTALALPTDSGLNTIQYVITYQSGVVVFTITGDPGSPWSECNANHQFAFNTANGNGQALYHTVMAAQQQKKNVYIVGLGTCSLLTGSEDVNYVQINP